MYIMRYGYLGQQSYSGLDPISLIVVGIKDLFSSIFGFFGSSRVARATERAAAEQRRAAEIMARAQVTAAERLSRAAVVVASVLAIAFVLYALFKPRPR